MLFRDGKTNLQLVKMCGEPGVAFLIAHVPQPRVVDMLLLVKVHFLLRTHIDNVSIVFVAIAGWCGFW